MNHASPRITSRTARVMMALSIAAAVSLGAAACSSPTTPSASSDAGVIAPIIVDITQVDGTTVDVTVGNAVDINAEDPVAWQGTVSSDVAEFVPGKDDGSAIFNPGLQAKSVGTADVTLTNPTTGEVVSFKLNVT